MSADFELTWQPDDTDIRALARGLNEHAELNIGEDGFRPLAVFLRDADDGIEAGILAYLNWNWLQISLLWVDEHLRDESVGSLLMEKVESVGREEGCTHAHVSTFSFQAKTFYETLGYEIFATLEDYPPGHSRHFLKKAL